MVSQLVIATDQEDDGEDGDPARERERVRADEPGLHTESSPRPEPEPRLTSLIEPAINGRSTKRARPRESRSAGR